MVSNPFRPLHYLPIFPTLCYRLNVPRNLPQISHLLIPLEWILLHPATLHTMLSVFMENKRSLIYIARDRGDSDTVQGAQGGGLDDSGDDWLASEETLLKYLPKELRYIVRRMLSLDPASTPTVDEVLGGEWLEGIH